jgi:hypothetical protein
VAKRREGSILNCIFGIFFISQDCVGDSDESRAGADEHLFKRF